MSESTEYWQDKTGLYLNDLIDTQANRAMIEAMRAMHNRLLLMEAQSQAAESPAPPASETPSLPAIETQEGTPLTSTTSSTWLYPASRDGLIKRSVQQDIWDWLSSLRFHGEPQAVEITATLTLKGTIPPSGSLSQSTVAPNPGVNGVAGRCRARDIDDRRCERVSGHLGSGVPHMASGVTWVGIEPEDFPAPTPAAPVELRDRLSGGKIAVVNDTPTPAALPASSSVSGHEELCLYVSNGCKQCICRRKKGHDRGHSYKHDSELPPEQRIEPTPAALPASSPEAGRELDDKYFCATRLDDAQLGRHFCGRAKNHPGSHRDYMTGRTWESLSPPTEALG